MTQVQPQDPDVYCPKCNDAFSFAEGLQLFKMVCPTCGAGLLEKGQDWFSATAAARVGGSPSSFAASNFMAAGAVEDLAVAELLLPSKNGVDALGVRQFITSLNLPIALEYFGQGSRRVMLARGPRTSLKYLAAQINANWPRALLRILKDDPVSQRFEPPADSRMPREPQRFEVVLGLEEKDYLPLRVWLSFMDGGDPVQNLFAAILNLNGSERVWAQIFVARSGRPAWLREIQARLKMELQKGFVVTEEDMGNAATERTANVTPVSRLNLKAGFGFVALVCAALVVVVLGLSAGWWVSILLGVVFIAGLAVFSRFFTKKPEDDWARADLKLIRQKVIDENHLNQVLFRVNVWAATSARAQEMANRFLSALSQYGVAGGNRFSIVEGLPLIGDNWPVRMMGVEGRHWMWLTAAELGGLWHPPLLDEQVAPGLVPVRAVETRAPDPEDVLGVYQIGTYLRPDGESQPVNISTPTLKRSQLLVGKPGMGKTTMMEHIAMANLLSSDRPAVVVIDPHGDMANRLMGAIPASEIDRVRVLDVGDKEFILSYNPLDVLTNKLDVDQASQSIIDVGSSLWADFWGPRMQVPLKRAVMAITAVNEKRLPNQALGLAMLTSLLNVSHETRRRFLEDNLRGSPYEQVLFNYFNGEYKDLTPSLREQIIQPVTSKASRFEENPMLALFSSPYSKLNFSEILEKRQILIVNTQMSKYGAELSGFVGSMLINFLIQEVVRQGETTTDQRVPVAFIIDEFQTFNGVSWQELLAQLRKWGGRTVLGTQNLASLREAEPELVGQIFAGIFGLYAFNMNGEDAEYLTKYEFSSQNGGPSADTLTALEPYAAYARLTRQDGNPTRPFYFTSREPVAVDPVVRDAVWQARAGYSARLDEARADAQKMMSILTDRYAGGLLNTAGKPQGNQGRGGPQSPASVAQAAINEAGEVLRGGMTRSTTSGPHGTSGGDPALWHSVEDNSEDPNQFLAEENNPALPPGVRVGVRPGIPPQPAPATDFGDLSDDDINSLFDLGPSEFP